MCIRRKKKKKEPVPKVFSLSQETIDRIEKQFQAVIIEKSDEYLAEQLKKYENIEMVCM